MANRKEQHHALGVQGEKRARKYLARKGCKFIAANVATEQGEVDLIMFDRDTLVFVEVKTRSDERFASGEQAVTGDKRRHIQALARHFVNVNRLRDFPCRFDVIVVTPTEGGKFEVRHRPNAFSLQLH